MTSSTIFDNEASAVDLWVYDELKKLGWTLEMAYYLRGRQHVRLRRASVC